MSGSDVMTEGLHVPKPSAVVVDVVLCGIADECHPSSSRHEVLEVPGCREPVALPGLAGMRDLGSTDPSLGFAELSVRACLEGIVVCWFGEVDGELL